jgi:hypothetical protein
MAAALVDVAVAAVYSLTMVLPWNLATQFNSLRIAA